MGPLAVVTGANGGLGIELCRQLLLKGFDLVLACRSARTCDAAAARLRRALPAVPGAGKDADVDARLVQLPVDLSSFASVRAAAAALEQQLAGRPLDVLCCNAAAIPTRLQLTGDGFELQAQSNHLGHFLLVHLLLPSLRRAPAGRVVLVGSELHRKLPPQDATPDAAAALWRAGGWEGGPYDWRKAYSTTKLLNVWHASHLATLLPPNVTANVVSPGWVPGTQLSRHVAGALLTTIVGTLGPCLFPSVVITPQEGARRMAAVCMGTDEAEGGPNGLYFSKRRPTQPSEAACDAAFAARAFQLSMVAIGLSQGEAYGGIAA